MNCSDRGWFDETSAGLVEVHGGPLPENGVIGTVIVVVVTHGRVPSPWKNNISAGFALGEATYGWGWYWSEK
jgi:hypothetical protein